MPETDVTLKRIRDGIYGPRSGVDVKMQARMSVSPATMVAGDGPIVRAQGEAVQATLDFVGRHLPTTRRWDRAANKAVRRPRMLEIEARIRTIERSMPSTEVLKIKPF